MATVNYSWTLPTVGASVNTWGTLLNTIIDDIDAKMVSKTGTQTLTNKTLAAPTFTGGITVSSGGASITGDTSVTGTLGVSSTLSTTSGSAVRLYRPDNATYTDISMAAGASGGLIFNNANSDGFTFKNTGSTVAQFSSTGLAVTGSVSATGASITGNLTLDSTNPAILLGTSAMQIYKLSTDMRFYNGSADRMTLDASGKLGVNCVPAYRFHVSESTGSAYTAGFDNTHASQPYGLSVLFSAASPNNTTNTFLICSDNTADRLRIYSNGNVVNTLNSYGAISDLKLKQDITDATPKLAKLLKVRIVNYKLKADPNGIKQIGVIAQELEEISPGLIEETPDFEEVTLTREVEKTVAVTVKKEVTTERVQLDVVDGVAVQTVMKETATVDVPVVDEYPVFDGDGKPVMEVVTPATDAEIDDKGNEVKAASPAVLRQKIHAVPRMETVLEKEEYTERRPTGTATKSVKYSIFVPMLIKAMQEQQAQIEELKAKVGA